MIVTSSRKSKKEGQRRRCWKVTPSPVHLCTYYYFTLFFYSVVVVGPLLHVAVVAVTVDDLPRKAAFYGGLGVPFRNVFWS